MVLEVKNHLTVREENAKKPFTPFIPPPLPGRSTSLLFSVMRFQPRTSGGKVNKALSSTVLCLIVWNGQVLLDQLNPVCFYARPGGE